MNLFVKHKMRGFTLLEMMVALMVLSILGTLSYNPLLSIYQAQKSKTYVQTVMNKLRAVQQQAIANHQPSSIQFNHSVSGTQHTLTMTQTINPGTPTPITVKWETQKNTNPIVLKLNSAMNTQPILKMSSRGDWLDAGNNSLGNFVLRHGNYGVQIVNGAIQRCEVNSSNALITACL